MAFTQTALYRFLFLLIFSAALMIVDHRSQLLAPTRTTATVLNLPFQSLIDLPMATLEWFEAYYPDDSLHQKYTNLQADHLNLQARLQRYDALQRENQRLTGLLSLSRQFGDQALSAEIIAVGPDPYTHRLMLNRGTESGVYLGQPAVTPDWVLGQVSRLGINRSVVTLITDSTHALPVRIQRNGLRTIVRGLGVMDRVEVPFLPAQADIRKDDILVTSGIGGGFPVGYKVARVREVAVDANAAFMRVDATTFVRTELTGDVLLLWVNKAAPHAPTECEVEPTARLNNEDES